MESINLTPNLFQLGNRLIETYQRPTRATDDNLQQQGLDPNETIFANVGTASIEEYLTVTFHSTPANTEKRISLDPLSQAVMLKSLAVNNSATGSLELRIYGNNGVSSGVLVAGLTIPQPELGYLLPPIVVQTSGELGIVSTVPRSLITVTLKPIALLGDLNNYVPPAPDQSFPDPGF